ncbi:ATP-dependent DNA ligase [Candidatus Dependentiae bacterium]
MKFSEVAEALESLDVTTSRLKITSGLAEIFKKATPADTKCLSYLLLGDLRAKYESLVFNVAEKNMVSAFAGHLSEGREEICGQMSLLGGEKKQKCSSAGAKEFKDLVKKTGDVGLAVQELHTSTSKGLNVKQVYDALEKIALVEGAGAVEKKANLLIELICALDAVSSKYVIRIILGKLRLGFSEMTLLDALSWMKKGDKSLRPRLEDAYNVSADIGLIAKTLKDGGILAIEKMHAKPGMPIRPAAAERLADADAILKKMGPCVAQPKLDGMRLQVHKFSEGGKNIVKFFSRNMQDVTHMFPELSKAAERISTKSFIAEGEAIAVDAKTGKFLPFQQTAKRRRKENIAETSASIPMKLFIFDLLLAGRTLILEKSHEKRREELALLFGKGAFDKRKSVQLIEEESFENAEGLEKYFKECIKSGLEGIIAKRLDAPYKAGKRNFNWVKLKRLETGSLEDTIDCVVLGYYRGRGKRAKFGIGALLVGIFNTKKSRFESVAKIGTGLTNSEWKEYKRECDKIAVDDMPGNVNVLADSLKPDVWIEPKIVCLVRADEISKSPVHSAGAEKGKQGLALRFPRIMGKREDKSPNEATTLKELESLREIQEKKGK